MQSLTTFGPRFAIALLALGAAPLLSACGGGDTSGSGGGGTTATGGGGTGGTTSTAGGGGTGGGGGSVTPVACPTDGPETTELPKCSSPASKAIDVPAGCIPAVDGTLHDAEWSDAACVDDGGDTLYIKYAGDAVYLAESGQPTCGCPMRFQFDPDGTGVLSGDEFMIGVFDDPFGADGDRADFVVMNGDFAMGAAPAGIETKCPGNQPTPVRYEWKIPYAALGLQAGNAKGFRFAFVHASTTWPAGVSLMGGGGSYSLDPSTWGTITSSTSWK